MILVALGFFAACNQKPTATRPATQTEQEDPLDDVRDLLRKGHDLESCKTIIQQVNAHLNRSNTPLAELSADERGYLEKHLNLTPEEIREITAPELTSLDANYLYQCLLLHDGLRSLDLRQGDDETSRLDRARGGFAWAMRQIWLSPQEGRPVPAVYALKRGAGGEPERAAVALSVFHQLGFDACLVGQEQTDGGIRMWAVGIGIGSDVLLFDPRGGQPILAADGKVATLKQVRSKPEILKSVVEEKTDPAALVKGSKLYLSPPLPALSTRATYLERTLSTQPPLRVAVSPRDAQQRLAQSGETVQFWNPQQEIGTPTRSLAYFLPSDEGGFDRNPRGKRILEYYLNSLAPMALLPPILSEQSISGDPGHGLRNAFAARFIAIFDLPNQPRDQILRGQLDDATNTLVEYLKQTNMALERIGNEPRLEEEAARWVERMREASARLARAQSRPGEIDLADAKAQVADLKKNSVKVDLYIEKAAAEPFGIQATFQLALCKHEQAVRQARQSRGSAGIQARRDAWQTAAGWWSNFLNKYRSIPYMPKGMIAQAQRLQADAQAGANESAR